MRCKRLLVIALAGLCFCWTTSAFAQETTATITGFIRDSTGAVIAGAAVEVRNTGTGEIRRLVSGSVGEYTATQLRVGRYELTADKAGFRKVTVTEIDLNVNDRRSIDVVLVVGATEEKITVEASAITIQTEDSTVGSAITGRQVRDMPLNGRSLYSLVALQPGVSAASGIVSGRVGVGLDVTSQVNVNGMRAAQNNWLIDGGDNVDTGSNLGLINYVSMDAVSEFRILRSNYSAEFGRSGGGQINVITKSGSNAFHGGAFEFFRNDAMDARNFFRPTCASIKATGGTPIQGGNCGTALLRYNNFGYNIGGPVKKDKLFFFFDQEFRKVRTARGAGVVNTRVPTIKQKQGDFSEFTTVISDPLTGTPFLGNRIPDNRIDPNAKALLGAFPDPNAQGALSGLLNYSSSAPGGRNYREEVVRVDYNISDKHRLFGRFIHDRIPSTEQFGEIFGTNYAAWPGLSNTSTVIPARNLVTEWNWMPNANIVNDVAFNYSFGGIQSQITGKGLQKNFPAFKDVEVYAFNDAGTIPSVSFGSGLYGNWDFFGPYDNTYGSYRAKDTLSWIVGKHALKVGYLYSSEYKNENAAGATNGSFNFPGTTSSTFKSSGDAFADFLLGRASSYTETDIDIMSHLRYKMHEAFFQDDWKARSNLTVNLGARWSYILPPTDTNNQLVNFDPRRFDPSKAYQIDSAGNRVPGTGDPLNGLYIAGRNSPYGDYIVDTHPNTVGPRVGFSWDPWSNGKTAVRGGYGIYFDRTLSGIALQNAFLDPPFANQVSISSSTSAGPTLSNPTAGTVRNPELSVKNLTVMSPGFKIPTTQSWSFGVQHEFPFAMMLDVSYVGNHATHLLRALRINQTPPGTKSPSALYAPYRGWGTITNRDTSASSRYDSLQVGLNKRYSRGLQYGFAYTWSKVMTDSPDDRTTIPQSMFNLGAERALAGFDKTHIFVGNFIYELPFFKGARQAVYNFVGGWQVGGIYRAEAGTPFTPAISPNQANSFYGGGQRPDLVGNPSGPRTVKQWFNTTAFALPAANTFGNASRAIIRGPGINLLDFSVYKNFKTTERVQTQFRADLFNAFNHTNLFNLGMTLGTSTFGQVTSALEPRQIQLGLRVSF